MVSCRRPFSKRSQKTLSSGKCCVQKGNKTADVNATCFNTILYQLRVLFALLLVSGQLGLHVTIVRTSMTQSVIVSCATFLFLPHFDVIWDLLLKTDAWQHGISLLTIYPLISTILITQTFLLLSGSYFCIQMYLS